MRVSEFISEYKTEFTKNNPNKTLTASKIRTACTAMKIDADDIPPESKDAIFNYISGKKNVDRGHPPIGNTISGNLTVINPHQQVVEMAFQQGCDTGEAEGEEVIQIVEAAYEFGRKNALKQKLSGYLEEIDSRHRLPSSANKRKLKEQDVVAMLSPGLVADRLGSSDDVIDAEYKDIQA